MSLKAFLEGNRDCEKKHSSESVVDASGKSIGPSADSIESFIERLRDVCPDDSPCHGQTRAHAIRAQAKQATALAGQLGILKRPSISWRDFLSDCADSRVGSEHVVELDETSKLVGKTTIPPGFGLIPKIRSLPLATRPGDATGFRKAIEFVPATPLEYLIRWKLNNEVFGDDVKLASVIHWEDDMVSFGITQPQYQGTPAESRDIDAYFERAGWTILSDPSHHRVFFNYAFHVIAIDAESRNCYLTENGLQPFDVILFEPGEEFERFLNIYPG